MIPDPREQAAFEWRVDVTYEVAILLYTPMGRLVEKIDKMMAEGSSEKPECQS